MLVQRASRGFTVVSWLLALAACMTLSGCSLLSYDSGYSSSSGRGKAYTVRGKTYRPLLSAEGFREEGMASWYGKDFHGKRTANGEIYNMHAMTAAHKLLPLGSKVRVTHIDTGKSITVRVNDRGPFVGSRVIDLSYAAAQELNMVRAGKARVLIESLDMGRAFASGDMSGNFFIQIAALSSREGATDLVRQLRKETLGGRAVYAKDIGLWRVQAGPFTSLTRAEDIAEDLGGRYPDNFVVAD